jgi:2-polyprenyl-3-methyl-5-hydroxy-6-metoxy-1,4-benzoquinol methylase
MESARKDHWSSVYQTKAPDGVSWHQPEPEPSLRVLDRFDADPGSAFIDVGGGASNLVDALLSRGWHDLTVLDLAAPALEAAKSRLGAEAAKVRWEVADITSWQPTRQYDVWHDRAVFHFLTTEEQREAYRRAMSAGVRPGGLVIMATFALDGPEKCSGLPVQRYDAESLAAELGDDFVLLDGWGEQHVTPWGAVQSFNWCAFHRIE